jgi:hypothetical protein
LADFWQRVPRLARTQAWLWNNRGQPDIAETGIEPLAEAYAGPGFRNAPYWNEFAEMELAAYRKAWNQWNPEKMGVASRPRVVDLDYELILVAHADGTVYTEPTPIIALPFLMHMVDGEWKVANAGFDQRVKPGWPPDLE